MKKVKLTTNQLKRMPSYLDLLRRLSSNGMKYISCQTIADCLSLNKEQVRKVIALVSNIDGVPNRGRDISILIKDIETSLGMDNSNNALLVGVGSLGTALLNFNGFSNYGLKIVAAFDNNPSLIGKTVNCIPIYSIDSLEELTKTTLSNVHIGIITVPHGVAQEICDKLVSCGMNGIWNFAPVSLDVGENTIVSNMDMASSLATLSHKLYLKNKKGL